MDRISTSRAPMHCRRLKIGIPVSAQTCLSRTLVKGGKIHPRYRIMAPPEFVETSTGAADGP